MEQDEEAESRMKGEKFYETENVANYTPLCFNMFLDRRIYLFMHSVRGEEEKVLRFIPSFTVCWIGMEMKMFE
jgi:hypothetical protein